MRWMLLFLAVGCVELDPLDEAWNRVYEVTAYARAEDSCTVPTAESEPPERRLAIGLGRTFDGVWNASTYWCDSATSCDVVPFSNAVLDTTDEGQLKGYYVDTAFDSRRLCAVTWAGIDAQQSGDTLSLVTRFYVGESKTEVTSDDCQAFAESLLDERCSETVLIQARRLPR